MITCVVCGQEVTSKRGLVFHIKKHSIDSFDDYVKMFPEQCQLLYPKDETLLTCPICGRYNMKQLSQHIVGTHKMTHEQFKELYPEQPLFIDAISERCSRAGKIANNVVAARKQKDPDRYKDSYRRASETRRKNNPDIGIKIAKILESHGVYERMSARSKKLWQDSSYREMQSKKCKKQHEEGLTEIILKNSGKKRYPITIGNITYHMRSKWECQFAQILYNKKIPFIYEKIGLEYNYNGKSRKYFPDFVIEGTNIIFEVKPKNLITKPINDAKKLAAINIGYDFRYITEEELKDQEKIDFSGC